MIPDTAADPLLRHLNELRSLTPDLDRDARVRARCHEVLARRQGHQARRVPTIRPWRGVVAPIAILGFCALYVASLVRTALHLQAGF